MKNKNPNSTSKSVTRMLLVSLGSGALTLVVAGLAVFAGFTIDRQAGTDLRWTWILLIASMPISLGGAYLISRGAVRKMRAEQAALEAETVGETPEEEAHGDEAPQDGA